MLSPLQDAGHHHREGCCQISVYMLHICKSLISNLFGHILSLSAFENSGSTKGYQNQSLPLTSFIWYLFLRSSGRHAIMLQTMTPCSPVWKHSTPTLPVGFICTLDASVTFSISSSRLVMCGPSSAWKPQLGLGFQELRLAKIQAWALSLRPPGLRPGSGLGRGFYVQNRE